MLLSSQALWPIENSAVTRIRTMAHKLKISVVKESTTSTDVKTFFLVCSDIFIEKWGNRLARGEVFILTQSKNGTLGSKSCRPWRSLLVLTFVIYFKKNLIFIILAILCRSV